MNDVMEDKLTRDEINLFYDIQKIAENSQKIEFYAKGIFWIMMIVWIIFPGIMAIYFYNMIISFPN